MSNNLNNKANEIEGQFIADLRDMAKNGATVPEMILKIQNTFGVPPDSPFSPIVCIVKAFGISIHEAQDITLWNRFPHGKLEADVVNRLVMPAILKNRGFCDQDYRNSDGSSDST